MISRLKRNCKRELINTKEGRIMSKLETPVGTIEIKPASDEDYPGFWIEIEGEGMILIEYNPDIQGIRALVWDPIKPDDDPIAVHSLT